MRIIKKDGTVEIFNGNKIRNAVRKSSERTNITLSDDVVDKIVADVFEIAETISEDEVSVDKIHNCVEIVLDRLYPDIAKSYRDYRNYKKDFIHMMDEVYRKSQSIRYIGDKDNANTDSALVATKRSLIFNELNKELYRKFFMTKDELQACKDGYIYIHDQSARLDTFNCILANIGDIMKNGFEMGNLWYNEPKSLDVAFDVIGDIILSTAAQQYGGYTVYEIDKLLIPYAEKSYWNYRKEYSKVCSYVEHENGIEIKSTKNAEDYVMEKLQRDFEQGFQGLEMKLNSVGSSRGDYPFVTLTFGLSTHKFGKMASMACLKVRMNGQGKEGFKKPVLFPKLVFLYDDNLHGRGKENEDIFEAGVLCSSKSNYPDWLSLTGDGYIAEMYKKYGTPISPMGCVDGKEVITYKFNGYLYVESFERMWNRLSLVVPPELQENGKDYFIDCSKFTNGIQIKDMDKFVFVKAIVRNISKKWVKIKFNNGRFLDCTIDHPLPIIDKGRTYAEDVKIGDKIEGIFNQSHQDLNYSITEDFAWALGVMLCDGCYDEQLSATFGKDELKVVDKLADVISQKYNLKFVIKEYNRGIKGNYYQINFLNASEVSKEFEILFGGKQKKYRNIPSIIFNSNDNIRMAFLAGMIDADGYINNTGRISKIQIGSTNKELSLQQMLLIQSLGNNAHIYLNKYNSSKDSIRYKVESEVIEGIENYIVLTKKISKINHNRRKNRSISESAICTVTDIEFYEKEKFSYDVTTETDYFDVSGIHSHNCRSFLSPWYEKGGMEPVDENDKPIYQGRFNMGVVSLNLPMILAKSKQENKDFYEILDYYLEIIRNLHKRTVDYLGELKASVNPVMFCEGGVLNGHLKPNDKIKPLLKPMTTSFGITALNELQRLYNGKSLYEDGEFALDVMKYIDEKVKQFKYEDGILHSIYGTPGESLLPLQVRQFRKKYGIIENVSDKEYMSNSFHMHVSEEITPIEKQDSEKRFWDYFNGGKIQYVRYGVNYNLEALRIIIRRAMEMGFYEGVNMQLAYCEMCGYSELEMDVCPKCGSKEITKIDRVCGYLGYSRVHGDTRLNDGKMAEIAERKSM